MTNNGGTERGLNTHIIRLAIQEADRCGWVSPEWDYIRFLFQRTESDHYLKAYRAGWEDALNTIKVHIDKEKENHQ